MAVHVRCQCGRTFELSHLDAGSVVQCTNSKCRAQLRVPPREVLTELEGRTVSADALQAQEAGPRAVSNDKVRFRCACGKKLSAPRSAVGQNGACPACGAKVVVPPPAAAAPAAAVEPLVAEVVPPAAPLVAEVVAPPPAAAAAPVVARVVGPAGAGQPPIMAEVAPDQGGGGGPLVAEVVEAPEATGPRRAAFVPTLEIQWPPQCVSCFGEAAPTSLKLAVAPKKGEGASTAGAIVGGVAGGIVGAMVGGVVGSLLAGGLRLTPLYSVPICTSCLGRLSNAEQKAFAEIAPGKATPLAGGRVPVITREVRKGCVELTFRNPRYAAAFRKLNAEYVHDSIAELRNALAPADKKQEQAKGRKPGGSLRDRVLAALTRCAPKNGFYLAPDIPPKKLANARLACAVPQGEEVLGVLDCTSFGSAKKGMVFGTQGVYYRNDWSSKSSGRAAIPYADFASRVFEGGGMCEVGLDGNAFLNVSACQASKGNVISLLRAVQIAVE